MNSNETSSKSRNYWPWLLVSIPFAAVLFGMFMIATILYYPDDLVVDSYYKDGMAINRSLEMDVLAKDKKVTLRLLKLDSNIIEFEVKNVNDSAIEMKLYHVSDQSKDIAVLLVPEINGHYTSNEPGLDVLQQVGVWYIEFYGADDNWRLRKRVKTPLQSLEIVYHE